VRRMPVSFYASVQELPIAEVITAVIVDDLDDPGALGYHSAILGRPFIKVLAQDVDATGITLSHEIPEALIDPPADDWWTMPNGTKVAAEVCDPVEGDSYTISVQLIEGGELRKVFVSNYVLPEWMGAPTNPGNGGFGFDRMGRLSAPFSMSPGGYMVVEDANGNDSNVFARRVRHGGELGERNAGRKLAKADGRLMRRLRATPKEKTP
jgi:hypothetical protein